MSAGKRIYIGEPGSDIHPYNVPAAPTKPLKIVDAFGYTQTFKLDELIIGKDLDKENAFWKRCEFPKYFYDYQPGFTDLFRAEAPRGGEYGLIPGTGTIGLVALGHGESEELMRLYAREMYRREFGVHFKNGNDIEYLTNHHYFMLQWTKLYGLTEATHEYTPWRVRGYEYGEFFKYQRDVFYLIDLVWKDPNKLGLFTGKPKKTGITQLFMAYYLNRATMNREKYMGIMSKGDDAINVNMMYFIHGFDGLPMIFQPNLKNRGDKGGEMIFGEPPVRNIRTKAGKARQQAIQTSRPLNNRVWAAKVKAAGFDAPVMSDIIFDELAKYDTENRQSPADVFSRNQETVKVMDIFNGRIWIFFYPPEVDTTGFLEARKIWNDSKLSTIGKNPRGRTKTGVITHYISSLNSYRSCFDKYGNCDREKARRLNKMARDEAKGDKKAVQAKTRQYSETEKELWGSGGLSSVFDPVRVAELRSNLDDRMKAEKLFTEGKLKWENVIWEAGAQNKRPKKAFCNINFVPLTQEEMDSGDEGRLREYEPLPPDLICAALRMPRDDLGNLMPIPRITFGAADPTEWASGTEVITGSKNAFITMSFPSPVMDTQRRRIASKIIHYEYFFRPDNPREAYEDLVKQILYTGMYVIVEANKAAFATMLIEDGLGRYMVVKHKDTGEYMTWTPELEKEGKYSLIRTEKDLGDTIVAAIAQYIITPALGDLDYSGAIRSERLWEQVADFDATKTKLFDLVMAFGPALICGEVLSVMHFEEEDEMYDDGMVEAIWGGIQATA